MARSNWIDDDNNPALEDEIAKLEHFTQALADGQVTADELEKQENLLVDAMRAVESTLSDEQHAAVTKLLAELAAYSVMQTLHGLAVARVRQAVS
jgi:predicted transcriptional regulator